MPLGQWSGHIWAGKDLDPLVPLESRSPTPQIPWRAGTPSTPSRLDTRSPAIPSRNGFQSRCSTRCTTRASSRLSNVGRGKVANSAWRSAKTPSFETPRSLSPKSDSDEDRQLAKQAETIRKWSSVSQVSESYAQNPFTSLIEESESLLEPESAVDQQMLMIYNASLELTEVGISTVMAPTVARRFKTALEGAARAEEGGDAALQLSDPFHEVLFKEAMEAYTIYGRMESIVCEMEILIERVLQVLDDDGDHGFDIVTGKAIGVGLAPDVDEQKTKIIMERVFELLAALTAEAKSFNYMAWLQAMGESDLEVTDLVEEFISQKQEIRKLIWISNIEAEEALTSRLLTAAMTFAKWFDKMRKAADEFQDFLLKQYQEEGHYGYYKAKKAFQKQTEERKRWALRLLETKEACKKEAHESQGRRIQAQLEMRREREADKEEQPPPVSGLPISERARKSRAQIGKSPGSSPSAVPAAEKGRRFSWSSKRSSHMEEQIMTLLGHARQHLDELQILAQEQKVREQKAYELLLRMLMKSRVLERRKLRKATTSNISQRVNSLMPGRFVVMHQTKSWSELEDFSVTSSLLQQQGVCKDLNELTVTVELKDIWTGVEGKFLMKKKAKPKKQVIKSLQTQEQKLEAAAKSKIGNLWGKARDSVAAGSAVSAILGIQATKEAEAAAAREEQLRREAEQHAQAAAEEANDQYEDDDHEDLFNFPPHFSLVDVQLLLSDAAVTRTEKLRELRQEVSQVVQQVGAEYGREAWEYNAQKLEAHSNYNAWASLMPVMEKEMMSLGESGRFFLSRQDAANLQDLMRMMRSIKSQLAVETANRTHFEDEDDRWCFGSENHIRALIEQMRSLHITLNDRKQKAAKLDIRAELTQELSHLHPELRSTYGLVQKHKPAPKPAEEVKEEEEEEEEQDERLNSFKTFLFALKFKHKMSEAQNQTKLRETKVQLQGTIANAQKMMGEDFEATKKLEDEKEYAQTQLHYLRRLLTHIQMNESATYHLKQLRSERALAKSKLKAEGAGHRVSDPNMAQAEQADGQESPKAKGGKAKKGGRGRKSAVSTPGSPKSPKRSVSNPSGDDRAPRSWLARASRALTVPNLAEAETASPRRSVSPRQSTLQQIEELDGTKTRGSVFFAEDEHSDAESEDSGIFARPRPTLTKRNTIDERKAQFNRLFTSTMQRRLRTATDKGAALIFRKSLVDASKSQQITSKILDSKRVDLQNVLRLTLQRFGIKTNQRIQSAKEQHARWDGEVAYLNDKLRRGQGMESFWQDRYDGWLSQMEALFGESVYNAFVHADRRSDREQWSQRLQEALYQAFDQMREETPSLAVDVSHHVEVPEEVTNERTGTTTVRLGDVHMAKLMDRKPKQIEAPPVAAPPQVDVLQHNLPDPEPELVRPPAIPARPMRQPGVTSAALKLPKMPIILQPEEDAELPEGHSKSTAISHALASRQLPSWLTARGNHKQSSNDLEVELESEDVSEVESKHINLARRRTVQPWLESVEWIEDVSYRAALKTLQKQFYRGKTQEEEAWGFQEPVQHHRHVRKKVTNPAALDRQAERNLSKKMQGFNLQELEEVSAPVHHWPASRPSKSLRRARPRSRAKAARGLDCIVANHGVRYRGPGRWLFQEPSVATSGTEATDAPEGGLSSDAALRRLRRFRRRMLKRFCGAEEAYNFVVTTPIADLDYEAFCELAGQISFNLDHTRMVWDKLGELLPRQARVEAGDASAEAMRKTEFAHVMSFACSLRDLITLRIRLQLRYGSLSAAFDHMDRRYLDQESWKELLVSVGASAEEAKNFFMMMMANNNRQSPKISRRSFLLVLRNAEGFAASRSLFHSLKLSNEAVAWRALMEFARRTAKHKGLRQEPGRSITATELHTLLASVSSEMQCEALLRMAMAKRQRDRTSGVLRLEEVLLVAVAGLGQRAEELKKELGRDYDGEDVTTNFANLLRQPGTLSANHRSAAGATGGATGGATARLRRSMAVSVAEAAGKLQRGEPHQGTMTLLGIVGQRPPSHVRSYQSSDSEDLRSISSRSAASRPRTGGSRSPTRSPRILE